MIKLFILDVDGVLTDGTKTYDVGGQVISKRFNDKDWTAIKRMKAAGVKVVALSGDDWNRTICERRNVPFFVAKNSDGIIKKSEFVPFFMSKYKVTRSEMAYVGDDIFDIDILEIVDYPFCPADAVSEVKKIAHTVEIAGGEGVVARVYDWCRTMNVMKTCSMDDLRAIDAQDK